MAEDAAALSARLAEQTAGLARLLATAGTGDRAVAESVTHAATSLRRLADALGLDVDRTLAAPEPQPAEDGRRALPPLEVTVPVLGVEACAAGWVGAVLEPGAPRPRIAVASTIADLVETVRQSLAIQAVAIDIPSGQPDQVLEVDAWVRSRPTVMVLEAHPELSFAAMSGAPIVPGRKTDEGRAARLAALRAAGLASPSVLNGSGYAADDVLDACAVAWTAARRMNGEAHPFPDPPQTFSDGIPSAIWV